MRKFTQDEREVLAAYWWFVRVNIPNGLLTILSIAMFINTIGMH